jgi:hypothetical protein
MLWAELLVRQSDQLSDLLSGFLSERLWVVMSACSLDRQ